MDKIALSLGGSLLVPNTIDTIYINHFRDFILHNISKTSFFITVGGGKVARDYINAIELVRPDIEPSDLDWMGIHTTRLNAHCLKTVLSDVAQPTVIKNPLEKVDLNYKVFLAGGYKPGNSTDCIAVRLAKNNNIETVINLTNTKYAYDKDPRQFADAKPIEKIGWSDFRKIVGDKWIPGMNVPFDPIASKEAEEYGIKVIIADGKDLHNIQNILDGKKYEGTTIY